MDDDLLARRFDVPFANRLALREKQIQQRYRPLIGVHKWFARRPGSLFRCLLLAEFGGPAPLSQGYYQAHRLRGVIADPFMGGGTPIFEANRLGLHVIGADINPMAWWIVRQALAPLDAEALRRTATEVLADVEREIGDLYRTACVRCGDEAVVKYFLWVKTARCPGCGAHVDLFPGYLLAEAVRHPAHVLVCAGCGELNEVARLPPINGEDGDKPPCSACGAPLGGMGPARRQQAGCRACGVSFPCVPDTGAPAPPRHRMWAIEYHCAACKPGHKGRFFKKPDAADLRRLKEAEARLQAAGDLPLPADEIPAGDESDRLRRWGYRRYRELFADRQLLGLGLLLRRVLLVPEAPERHALLTVFSDSLRYQNLLCRYDTYALKCQDIFSVHGFPVGLVQCENNLLGIPGVGSGSFRHFLEKYLRAKRYCEHPFEFGQAGSKTLSVPGERVAAVFTDVAPRKGPGPGDDPPQALLHAGSAEEVELPPLDGVFTDPPYYDNVQYAELMDFCYAWLRLGLGAEFPAFARPTTRSPDELTGNETLGRGLVHFTAGLSAVFRRYAGALRPGGPFVFTYHHNDPVAYLPIVVALLDAGLRCVATLPAAAEMGASLHIAGTSSSVLDSVFVCRRVDRAGRADQASLPLPVPERACAAALLRDEAALAEAGMKVQAGDRRCLRAGHLARLAVAQLLPGWDAALPIEERMARARACLAALVI